MVYGCPEAPPPSLASSGVPASSLSTPCWECAWCSGVARGGDVLGYGMLLVLCHVRSQRCITVMWLRRAPICGPANMAYRILFDADQAQWCFTVDLRFMGIALAASGMSHARRLTTSRWAITRVRSGKRTVYTMSWPSHCPGLVLSGRTNDAPFSFSDTAVVPTMSPQGSTLGGTGYAGLYTLL